MHVVIGQLPSSTPCRMPLYASLLGLWSSILQHPLQCLLDSAWVLGPISRICFYIGPACSYMFYKDTLATYNGSLKYLRTARTYVALLIVFVETLGMLALIRTSKELLSA